MNAPIAGEASDARRALQEVVERGRQQDHHKPKRPQNRLAKQAVITAGSKVTRSADQFTACTDSSRHARTAFGMEQAIGGELQLTVEYDETYEVAAVITDGQKSYVNQQQANYMLSAGMIDV